MVSSRRHYSVEDEVFEPATKSKANTFFTQNATVSDIDTSKFGACTVREEESIMKTYREGPKSS